MRRRQTGTSELALSSLLRRAIIMAAALAMVLFALPLAVAVSGLYRGQALQELARDAERTRGEISERVHSEEPFSLANLPPPHDSHVVIGVYDRRGVLVGGSGPAVAEPLVTGSGLAGVEDQGVVDGVVLSAVPMIDSDDDAFYVVRAAEPYSALRRSVSLTWALMAGLAALILVLVAALARSRARQIARPLQRLAESAELLGGGDFSVRAVRSGVAEVDAASASLERTARRLGGMLERERSFSADASHQLRTPLTAVRVGLEAALLAPGADVRQAIRDGLRDLDRLEETVVDLLALARDTRSSIEATDVALLAAGSAQQWSRRFADAGRRIDLDGEPDLPPAAVSPQALRTVLDVLLDNALTHGQGRVQVRVRADADAVVVQMQDDGPGVSGDPRQLFVRRSPESTGTGIGLALARSLVEADGGRLDLLSLEPAVFAVLLPQWRPPDDHVQHDGPEQHDGPATGAG